VDMSSVELILAQRRSDLNVGGCNVRENMNFGLILPRRRHHFPFSICVEFVVWT
jgi:hypothetical protein